MEILDKIEIDLNPKKIGERLYVQKTGSWDQFQGLYEAAKPLITPKAAYGVRYIGEKLEEAVVIDGTCLRGRVLRKNLETVGRVFPHVVTIGPALEAKADASQDLLEKYYLDSIGNAALIRARKYLEDELRARFAMEGLSFMSPVKHWRYCQCFATGNQETDVFPRSPAGPWKDILKSSNRHPYILTEHLGNHNIS